jgi:hypothetical protein
MLVGTNGYGPTNGGIPDPYAQPQYGMVPYGGAAAYGGYGVGYY